LRAVFEIVIHPDHLDREFAGLAHRDEAGAERDRDRRSEDEASRFHAGDVLGAALLRHVGEVMHARGERARVTDHGRDVAELDAGHGKVGHGAHQRPDLVRRKPPVHGHRFHHCVASPVLRP